MFKIFFDFCPPILPSIFHFVKISEVSLNQSVMNACIVILLCIFQPLITYLLLSYVAIGGIVKALEDTFYILTQLLAIKHYLDPLFKWMPLFYQILQVHEIEVILLYFSYFSFRFLWNLKKKVYRKEIVHFTIISTWSKKKKSYGLRLMQKYYGLRFKPNWLCMHLLITQ